jgi:hypothetical protein
MPLLQDFSLTLLEDGIVTLSMQPPTNISGWFLQFALSRRLGAEFPILTKYCGSGVNNFASGMNILNGAQGFLQIQMNSADLSGYSEGNYAWSITRLDSGFRTVIACGYEQYLPTTPSY